MNSRSRTWTHALITAALLTLPLTLLTPLAPAHADGEPDPLAGAPAAGACYDVAGLVPWTKDSTTADPIPCTRKHTLWVVGVKELPTKVPLDFEDSGFQAAVARLCTTGTAETIGVNDPRYARAAYQQFVLIPTLAQRADGAHWVSCSLGIFAGRTALARTKLASPPSITKKLPRRAALCATRRTLTNCAARHTHHATFAKKVHLPPTDANVRRASQRCAGHVKGKRWLSATRFPARRSFWLVCLSR